MKTYIRHGCIRCKVRLKPVRRIGSGGNSQERVHAQVIGEKDRAVIQEMFEGLVEPVKLVVFTEGAIRPAGARPCQYCEHVVGLAKELSELTDKLEVEIVNFYADKEKVAQYDIQRIPAIAVVGAEDYGIRFYGIPAGFEFAALLEDIIDVSKSGSDLSRETLEKLERIDSPMHIQVFVTPTCPYCPPAVRLAQKFAMANENIKADMVEAQEFPSSRSATAFSASPAR